jgi:hypothetical protein
LRGRLFDTIPGMRERIGPHLSLAILLAIGPAGCGEAWINLTTPLGGSSPGARGDVGVIVLNNTPYRAVFSLGSYDQSVPGAAADFVQFPLDGLDVLDGDDNGGLLTLRCARVVSLGGGRLIERLENQTDVSPDARIEGIEFYDVESGESPALVGAAAPLEVLLGVDFLCNALLIFKLEENIAGPSPFRIDYELIPSADAR